MRQKNAWDRPYALVPKGGKVDRRSAPRYPANESRINLAWSTGNDYQNTDARIVNISQTGALIEVDRLPPGNGPLWMRLGEHEFHEWVEARLVAANKPWFGRGRLRVHFSAGCPFDFFKTVVIGRERRSLKRMPEDGSSDATSSVETPSKGA